MKRAAIGATVDLSLRGIENDPRRSMKNAVDLFGHLTGEIFGESLMAKIRREAENPKSCFYRMITAMVRDVDHAVLKTVGTNMCFNRVGAAAAPAKPPEPRGPVDLPGAVRRARAKGIYFFVVCGKRPLRYAEELFAVCRENRDCAFYLTADAGEVSEDLADRTMRAGNIILAVRIDTDVEPNRITAGCSRAFEILKRKRCLYGYIAKISSAAAKLCCSNAFIDCMAKYGCLFGWYYAGKAKDRAACRQAIARLMDSALISRIRPLLLLDPVSDRAICSRFVTGGRCYLIYTRKRMAVRFSVAPPSP